MLELWAKKWNAWQLSFSTQNRKLVYIPHRVGQTFHLLLCWPFVTSILQHYTHTHTKIYTCFSCIMDQYINRDLKVVLSQCPPQGKSIKASQQWAISPSLADHFPSNILGPSSSEADQCCWKQKTVHSVWEQWVKWKTHWIDDFVNESWGRLCETNMPPTPTPQNTSPIALITNKLAIQSVALGLPSVYVDA